MNTNDTVQPPVVNLSRILDAMERLAADERADAAVLSSLQRRAVQREQKLLLLVRGLEGRGRDEDAGDD